MEFHDRTTVVCVVFGMEKSSMVKFVGTGLAIAGALIMLEVESFGNCNIILGRKYNTKKLLL